MGQVPTSWCRDGHSAGVGGDFAVKRAARACASRASGAASAAVSASCGCPGLGGQRRPEPAELQLSKAGEAAKEQWLLAGVPRELVEALREAKQWAVLRCRPWLSAAAWRGLLRNLQLCQLRQVAERSREAEAAEDGGFSVPMQVPWPELDLDHVINAGQVFRLFDIPIERHGHLRRTGIQALRQGKVAVALLAGGANFRLGLGEPPVGCLRRALQLPSGKSVLQLCCERVRRVAALCCAGPPDPGKPQVRPSIPVFVMTSRLTHRTVTELFEAHGFFGLQPRDVFFFEQPVQPLLGLDGQLLPQSLGGAFAHAPGGTGLALRALAGSTALEQLRDRGVEYLHVVGTENVLAKVCDPVFIGFCRDVDLDCACKVVERADVAEDLELFCVRRSLVSTQFADIEEAACGVEASEAPSEVLNLRGASGALSYCGSINSVFLSLSYVEEVVGRPLRQHRVARAVPYLDFHLEPPPEGEMLLAPMREAAAVAGLDAMEAPKAPQLSAGIPAESWPAEAASPDLTGQRALQAAAAEVRALCEPGPEDTCAAWRCDVHLDPSGPLAVVRVRSAQPGPAVLPQSLRGPGGLDAALAGHKAGAELRCSLVVPRTPNTWVLETSILDYFAYTDRAVALQVTRASEFAPVREPRGRHTPDNARRAMHLLHCSWLCRAGALLQPAATADDVVEVSPLLSYEGEELATQGFLLRGALPLPCHLAGHDERPPRPSSRQPDRDPESEAAEEEEEAPAEEDGLDTRQYYLQEYPSRPELNPSHAPRFLGGPGAKSPAGDLVSAKQQPSAAAAAPPPGAPPAPGRGDEAPAPAAGWASEVEVAPGVLLGSERMGDRYVLAPGRGVEAPTPAASWAVGVEVAPGVLLGSEPMGDRYVLPGL